MKIKVCGMRDAANIEALCQINIDYIGFIFYNKSPRYIESRPLATIPPSIKRVGVFVNANLETIEQKISAFQLDFIQLHGNETVDFCQELRAKNHRIIKAFAVDEHFDFGILKAYEASCDYFLLDAKGKSYGGNGIAFDWKILDQYSSKTPFFLSGGIDLENIQTIKQLKLPELIAIDVNSKFEISPALKNTKKIKELHQAFSTEIAPRS